MPTSSRITLERFFRLSPTLYSSQAPAGPGRRIHRARPCPERRSRPDRPGSRRGTCLPATPDATLEFFLRQLPDGAGHGALVVGHFRLHTPSFVPSVEHGPAGSREGGKLLFVVGFQHLDGMDALYLTGRFLAIVADGILKRRRRASEQHCNDFRELHHPAQTSSRAIYSDRLYFVGIHYVDVVSCIVSFPEQCQSPTQVS